MNKITNLNKSALSAEMQFYIANIIDPYIDYLDITDDLKSHRVIVPDKAYEKLNKSYCRIAFDADPNAKMIYYRDRIIISVSNRKLSHG